MGSQDITIEQFDNIKQYGEIRRCTRCGSMVANPVWQSCPKCGVIFVHGKGRINTMPTGQESVCVSSDGIDKTSEYTDGDIGEAYGICEGDIRKGESLLRGKTSRHIKRLDALIMPKAVYIGTAVESGTHGDKIKYFCISSANDSDCKEAGRGDIQSRERVIDMSVTEEDLPQETNLAIPGLEAMGKHVKTLSKRKQLKEAQMVGLAKELFMLSAYKSQKSVLVENCKFSVGFSCGDVTQPNAMLISLYLRKVTKKDKGKITWLDLVTNITQKAIIFQSKIKKDEAIATFSVNKEWVVVQKDMSNKFLRLLPTGRALVREQLDIEESEALADIAYLESMDEMAEEVVNG